MAAKEEMTALAGRKRLLLLESGVHRDLIALECEGLRAQWAPLENLRASVSRLNPWWLAGGAAAGLLAARRWGGLLRWLPTALAAWRWLRRQKPG